MNFYDLSETRKLQAIKREFHGLVVSIFSNANHINKYIQDKTISEEQAIKAVSVLQLFNNSSCVCCRSVNSNKLLNGMLPVELYPLIDIARIICIQKLY